MPRAGGVRPVGRHRLFGVGGARGGAAVGGALVGPGDARDGGVGVSRVRVTEGAVDGEAVQGPAVDLRVRGSGVVEGLAVQARRVAVVVVLRVGRVPGAYTRPPFGST